MGLIYAIFVYDDVIITGDEIMECDMEIEDESPEASGIEEATPPREPSTAISVAPPIPVPPALGAIAADHSEGQQKVNQALPPGSREVAEEDNEPLPPGVEDSEPLPPGIEASSDSPTGAVTTGLVSQEPGRMGVVEQPGE